MSINRLWTWSSLCVGLLLWTMAVPGSAQRSLECQKVWTGPSEDNDIVECAKNSNRILMEWKYYVFPAAMLLLFLSCISWLTCIYCGCYCKCCCTCINHKPTKEKSHYKLRKSCLTSLCLIPPALCICVMFVVGAIFLHQSIVEAVKQAENGPLDYLKGTKLDVDTLLTDYSKDPPEKVDIDLSEFDDAYNTAIDEIDNVKDFMKKTVIPGISVAAAVGALVLFLTVVSICVTRCGWMRWCGGICGWLYYLLATIYAALAFVMALVFYAVCCVCGEVRLQYKRQPGIFQWYVIPKVESEFNFTTVRNSIDTEVLKSSEDACTELLKVCDPPSTASSTKPFVCGGSITASTDCTTFQIVSTAVEETYINPTTLDTECPAPDGMTDWKCYMEQCVTFCKEEELRTNSASVIEMVKFAQNATTALSLVEPMLEPNYLVDLILTVLESKANSELAIYHHKKAVRCTNFRLIAVMFAIGFFLGSLILLVTLCVLLSAWEARKSVPKKVREMPSTVEEKEDERESQVDIAKELQSVHSEDAVTGAPIERDTAAVVPSLPEPEPYTTSTYGIPAGFYQDNSVDEEEMLNRARQTSNRRLPLNPLAR